MTRELVKKILSARAEFEADGEDFATSEGITVEVLFATGGTPVPISRVSRVETGADYITVETESAFYCLEYGPVVGLKITHRADAGSRTGFRR